MEATARPAQDGTTFIRHSQKADVNVAKGIFFALHVEASHRLPVANIESANNGHFTSTLQLAVDFANKTKLFNGAGTHICLTGLARKTTPAAS